MNTLRRVCWRNRPRRFPGKTTPARKGSAGSVGVDLPFSSGERADHASHSAICETTGRLRCFNDGYGAYGEIVMVPVALWAGRYGDRWGRKPVMAVAFWALPLRIFSYTLVSSPKAVVWLTRPLWVGAGIYGVVVIALAADLTKGKGRFNTLAGLFATALAVGGVAGPLIQRVSGAASRVQDDFLRVCHPRLGWSDGVLIFCSGDEARARFGWRRCGRTGGLKLRSRIDPQRLLRAQIGIVAEVG